jgi:DedD protein
LDKTMPFMSFSHTSVGRRGCLAAVVILLPALAGAQSARDSSLYVRAQQMVANGDAAGGRKLADSVAAAAPAASSAYAEGLFWKATLAENARDSEHAYRQIIVDYPLSGRVPDALLRIGQLESARGENAAALQHFQRLVLEHPQSPLRPEASYWVARMYFDTNDATRACTANAEALASVRPANIELKNRIDFQQQRCRGVSLATNAAPIPAPASAVPTTAPAPAPVTASVKKAAPAEAKTVSRVAVKAPVPEQKDTTSAPAHEPKAASSSTGVVSRPPTREEVARALASAETPTVSTSRASAARAPATSGSYAVQIAAFGTRPPATLMAAKLRGRGYDAYVDGASAPYRIRIGHYPTHAAAVAALVKLKAKRIDGFVAER